MTVKTLVPFLTNPSWNFQVGSKCELFCIVLVGDDFFPQDCPFPLSIVALHLALKFCLSSIWRSCRTLLNKCSVCGGKGPERRKDLPIVLSWTDYRKVVVTAVTSSWDIGLSQWSLRFITVALYTMTKSTSILFILFFAIFYKLERKV